MKLKQNYMICARSHTSAKSQNLNLKLFYCLHIFSVTSFISTFKNYCNSYYCNPPSSVFPLVTQNHGWLCLSSSLDHEPLEFSLVSIPTVPSTVPTPKHMVRLGEYAQSSQHTSPLPYHPFSTQPGSHTPFLHTLLPACTYNRSICSNTWPSCSPMFQGSAATSHCCPLDSEVPPPPALLIAPASIPIFCSPAWCFLCVPSPLPWQRGRDGLNVVGSSLSPYWLLGQCLWPALQC